MPERPAAVREAQIPLSHYLARDYDHAGRFASYWHQIDEVLRTGARRVLEVGIGNGLVHRYLRHRGVDVVTVDVNPMLEPDILADVTDLPLRTGGFEVILCAEVLEHLEFADVGQALSELRRVARRAVVLFVPDAGRCMRVHIDLPLLGGVHRVFELPGLWHMKTPWPDHRWELGLNGVGFGRLRSVLDDAGLSIERTYRVFGMPRHRCITAHVDGEP